MAAGAGGRAPGCLCVLCGLPAAGKSTLAHEVRSTASQRGWRAGVLSYDDLITEHAFQTRVDVSGGSEEMHTEWKLHRQAILQCVEDFLERRDITAEPPSRHWINSATWEQSIRPLLQPTTDQAPLLFLLDDNFYYPSMRYEVFRLARKHSLGFCQVYLHCDLDTCISRNRSRSEPIPTTVVLEMVKRLEPPNPQKNPWEKNSISLNSTESFSKCDVRKVMELISLALSNPPRPVEDNTEQTEADRLKCATSALHQADQACRRLVSDAMKTASEVQVPSDDMRLLAAELTQSKTGFLQKLRRQLLQEASLSQEDDVERVVKTALDAFDCERKEILSRITNEAK